MSFDLREQGKFKNDQKIWNFDVHVLTYVALPKRGMETKKIYPQNWQKDEKNTVLNA